MTPQDVLDFWFGAPSSPTFGQPRREWFVKNDDFDHTIRTRFGATITQALAGGRADSRILQEFGPKMAGRDYTPTGRIDNMMKDLEGVEAFAGAKRLFLPVSSQLAQLHRLFLAAGLGAADTAETMKQFDGFRE